MLNKDNEKETEGFFPTSVNYNKETKGYTQDYQPAET